MIREGHLSVYDLTLTTRSPLHLGTSRVINKTDYIFDPRQSLLTVLDTQKMFQALLERDLVEAYEAFILGGQNNMFYFLVRECGFTNEDIQRMSLYQVNTAGSLGAGQSLKDIKQIVRAPDGQVYIPGSSIKGAIRTALLLGPVSRAVPGKDEHIGFDYSFREGRYVNKIEYLNIPERDKYKLHGSTVSSVMQGIRISDSQPISNSHVALASKVDILPDGQSNQLNLMWECLPPGTQLHFKMTLDHSVLDHCEFNGGRGIGVDTILQAIGDFSAYYEDTFATKFLVPAGNSVSYRNAMLLGGNTGYFSKTLAYPYWKERALDEVSRFLHARFPKHNHKDDPLHGISPHTISYARYDGKLYPMGLCEVSIT